MPFVKATIVFRPASVGTGIKIGLRQNKGAQAAMTVFLSGEGVKALGAVDGAKCSVMIGEGEHHGLMRVQLDKKGDAEIKLRGAGRTAYLSIKLGHQPAFVDRTEPALWCQWEVLDDGWLEIVMPKWADETNPANRGRVTTIAKSGGNVVAVAPAKPEQKAPHMPPRKSATAELMGDPPPGRREMLKTIGNMKA